MSEETRSCTYCGSENPVQAKFCSNCGASLQATEEIQIDYGPVEEAYESNVQYETYNGIETQINGLPFASEIRQMAKGGNIGLAIASMVCGIVSIVCCCMWLFSLMLAIAAIVLGIIALNKKYDGKGMAIAGIITGGIGFLLSLFWLIMMGIDMVTSTIF